MLEQPLTNDRLYLRVPLERPYARGINLSNDVEDVDAVRATVMTAGWGLLLPLEERCYQRGEDEIGVRQFAVQDPDPVPAAPDQDVGTRSLETPLGGRPEVNRPGRCPHVDRAGDGDGLLRGGRGGRGGAEEGSDRQYCVGRLRRRRHAQGRVTLFG